MVFKGVFVTWLNYNPFYQRLQQTTVWSTVLQWPWNPRSRTWRSPRLRSGSTTPSASSGVLVTRSFYSTRGYRRATSGTRKRGQTSESHTAIHCACVLQSSKASETCSTTTHTDRRRKQNRCATGWLRTSSTTSWWRMQG